MSAIFNLHAAVLVRGKPPLLVHLLLRERLLADLLQHAPSFSALHATCIIALNMPHDIDGDINGDILLAASTAVTSQYNDDDVTRSGIAVIERARTS